MEATELIKTRRSIRKYQNKSVDKATIEEIVSLAAMAPSWKNSQSTRYTAVIDADLKSKIACDCCMGFEGNKNIISAAPVLIVVTTVNCRAGYERDGSFSTSKGTHWQSFDAGIATQTFCLAAHEKGLGTVVMGIFEEAKVKEVLGIDDTMSVSALVALGTPAETPDAPKRKEVEQLLTFK